MKRHTTKSVVFGLCLIRQVNTAPSNYKKLIQPTTRTNQCQLFSDLEIIEVVETEWHGDTRDFVLNTVQQNGR